MNDKGVRVDLAADGLVAEVVLDRPRTHNALNEKMLREVAEIFRDLKAHEGLRAVVVYGQGTSFSSGADRNDYPGGLSADGQLTSARYTRLQAGQEAVAAIRACNAVTIACIRANAIGGGLVLALACDLRVASTDARLDLPEVGLGVPLGWGAVPLLAAQAGLSVTRRMLLLGERVSPEEALRCGLVDELVPDDQVLETGRDWARIVCGRPPASMLLTKQQLRALSAAARMGDVTAYDAALLHIATESPEMRANFT